MILSMMSFGARGNLAAVDFAARKWLAKFARCCSCVKFSLVRMKITQLIAI
jgi:hypothetical protein